MTAQATNTRTQLSDVEIAAEVGLNTVTPSVVMTHGGRGSAVSQIHPQALLRPVFPTLHTTESTGEFESEKVMK